MSSKTNKPKTCTFLFDAIVKEFSFPADNITDVTKMSVNVSVNNMEVPITGSRINIQEFISRREYEFDIEAKKLRQSIEKCGLPMTVTYNKRILGNGAIIVPVEELDTINEDMKEFNYTGICEIYKSGEQIGTVTLICRIVTKCKDADIREPRRNLEQNIYPHDILFIVGESQKCPSPCDPCLDAWESEKDDEMLNLDLSRYRNPNSRAIEPPDVDNTCGTTACCELKQMAMECNDLINSITKALPEVPKSWQNQLNSKGKGHKSADGFNVLNVNIPPSGANSANQIDHFDNRQCNLNFDAPPPFCFPTKRDGECRDTDFEQRRISGGHMPLPELDVKPIRFCSVCLKNMSWLPEFAACPNCGVKPMPTTDAFAPKKLTADQILEQYAGKGPKCPDDDFCYDPCKKSTCEEESTCRCTCKHGKLCTHCRIRNLCADIFKAPGKTVLECPKVEPKSSDDFCVRNTSSKECRPYLARVFSELRDLYDVRKSTNPSEMAQKCNDISNFDGKIQSKTLPKDDVQTKISTKSDQLKESPICTRDSKLKTKNKISAGHKDCVKWQKRVPHTMGWLWTENPNAKKYGWRPGAIKKSIKRIMHYFLESSPNRHAQEYCQEIEEAKELLEREAPVLKMWKKNHEVFIQLRPIRNPAATKDCVGVRPITFKITKSPIGLELSRLKKLLKEMGFEKCCCHQPVYLCNCRHFMEKYNISRIISEECSKKGMDTLVDKLVLTDTSESEMEFDVDFSPPASTIKAPTPPKPRTGSHGTQFTKKDLNVEPKWPKKIDPYWRGYSCAVGDRYTGTAFGMPGENVYEDGAFGMLGGGPHGSPCGAAAKLRHVLGGRMRGPPPKRGAGFTSFPGGATQLNKIDGKEPKKSEPIPVRALKRTEKMLAEKAAAAKAYEAHVNKKPIVDMYKYLEKGGAFTKPEVGPDGLTSAQRKRKLLMTAEPVPLCMIKRRGKPMDPCACYPCAPCAPCAPCGPCGPCRLCDPCYENTVTYDCQGNILDQRWMC